MKVYEGLLRQKVDRRELLTMAGITESRNSSAVEVLQMAGFDSLMIDREHSALNTETISDLIRTARLLSFPCMIRAADPSYHEICRHLDQAPDGIFVPRIRTREEVETLVRTVRYGAGNLRGLGGSTCPAGKYAGWTAVTDQVEAANRTTVIGIQIETAEALENLDAILSVPGIDVAIVGNDDLSLGMGILGQWSGSRYHDAVMRIIDACHRHNVMPGIAGGDPEIMANWAEKGMRFLWYCNDIWLLWRAAADMVGRLDASLASRRLCRGEVK